MKRKLLGLLSCILISFSCTSCDILFKPASSSQIDSKTSSSSVVSSSSSASSNSSYSKESSSIKSSSLSSNSDSLSESLHVHSGGSIEWNDSVHWHTCDECDGMLNIEEHTIESKIVKKATHTASGKVNYYCTKCGYNYDEILPALVNEHRFSQKIINAQTLKKAADCTHDAEYYYSCTCGAISETLYFTLENSKLGHSWDEGHVSSEPTETKEGEMLYTCSVCNETKIEPIAKLEHVHKYDQCVVCDEALRTAATCQVAASYYYSCSCGDISSDKYFNLTTKLEHDVKACYHDDGKHEHHEGMCGVCSMCGQSFDEESIQLYTSVDNLIARQGNSTYGFVELSNETNSEGKRQLYFDLYKRVENLQTSKSDFVYNQAWKGYCIYINTYDYHLTGPEAASVWKIFYLENPSYYWLDMKITANSNELVVYINEDYAKYEDREKYDNLIKAKNAEIDSALVGVTSDKEKVKIIHDYIVSSMDYAYATDNKPSQEIWAHNLIGFVENGSGVCESYSKSFLYECLRNDIECLIVSGSANNESHAWNYVKLDDNWYGFDLTWDDRGNENPIVYEFYGMGKNEIGNNNRVTDTPSGSALGYLYALPELSDEALVINGGE